VPTPGDLPSYIDFIKEKLPLNDLTEIFGLHENAEITSAIGRTNVMLETALVIQGSSSSKGSGKSQDDIIKEIATDIL
jgi:dynein heavy chain